MQRTSSPYGLGFELNIWKKLWSSLSEELNKIKVIIIIIIIIIIVIIIIVPLEKSKIKI